MLFSQKKFILLDCFSGKVVYGNDELDVVVDMATKYSLSGGKSYQVFTNLLQVSHEKIPTLSNFGEE